MTVIVSDAVCDLETLKLELLQDLEDNNMLDCLREIDVPHNLSETENQKNIRLAAQWDSSCSFEGDNTWIDNMKKIYGVTQLVDSEGEPVKKDFDDQADMCELIRAAVAKNLFGITNLDMRKLPKTFVDGIQCAGAKGDIYGPQICAATSSSFYNPGAWNIMNKSSAITFDSKPQFVDKDPESDESKNNPWADESENTPEAVNDLNLLSKEQLDNAGGDIAAVINNALNGQKGKGNGYGGDFGENGNMDNSSEIKEGDDDQENDSSSQVHHYFKRSKHNFGPEKEFRLMDNGEVRFNSEGDKILMGIYMASFKLNAYRQFCMKMNLNEIEVPDSRQCIGNKRNSSISGAFAEKYTDSQTKVSVLSLSNGQGSIENDGEDTNLRFGAVLFPDLGIYKHNIGMETLNLPVTNKLFLPVDSFSMGINHDSGKPGFYIVITNFSIKLPNNSSFGILNTINGRELTDTTFVRGPNSSIGLSSTTVLELFPGVNQIGIKYMYIGSKNIEFNSSQEEGRYNQSITAFKLPNGTKVANFKPAGSVNLSTNSWMSFNINAKVDIQSKKHVMILYHIHIKVSNSPFSSRLKVNGNKSFKATLAHIEGEEFASIQGYLVKWLPAGSHEFDIEFLSSSKEMFDPASEGVDKQTVSIKIIEFP